MTKPRTLSNEELLEKLHSTGWSHHTADTDSVSSDRTLAELARDIHEKHRSGEDIGLVRNIENEIEVDLMQLQQIWNYMGLPQ